MYKLPAPTGRVVEFYGPWAGNVDDLVRYSGSLTDRHGDYTVLGLCVCEACTRYDAACEALGVLPEGSSLRYALASEATGQRLDHVRPESFAALFR